MANSFTASLLKAIFGALGLALVAVLAGVPASSHGERVLSQTELASVRGKNDEPGCLQYIADWENPSRACQSPYDRVTDNDCDWIRCTADNAADGCGTGRQFSNLNQATWLLTNYSDPDIAWRGQDSPCIGIIDCEEGPFNAMKSCDPSVPNGQVQGRGCHNPDPGMNATGCRSCTAGMPQPFNANNVDWTWYDQVNCPL